MINVLINIAFYLTLDELMPRDSAASCSSRIAISWYESFDRANFVVRISAMIRNVAKKM